MAWRSSGATNNDMVTNLKRFGVITSETVENGFRAVDRAYFVPKGNEELAHSDQPLKEGNVHISAPHIYGSALEALELRNNSSLSFLNIGSGTGYLSAIVSEILGPKSLNFGIEVHHEVIEHCHTSLHNWTASKKSATNALNTRGKIQIIRGNGLHLSNTSGESIVGFDRIYIGATIERSDLIQISKLLRPGGILVGPVEDELIKVIRNGEGDTNTNASLAVDSDSDDQSIDDAALLGQAFSCQILSVVRFSTLLRHPVLPTVIPAQRWSPGEHLYFPDAFQDASRALILCSNAEYMQPLPPQQKPEDCINIAAMLPRSIWIEILSFTHRRCESFIKYFVDPLHQITLPHLNFAYLPTCSIVQHTGFSPDKNKVEYLKGRLQEEKEKARLAQKERRDLEARCQAAERERDVYRLLARRWQTRLQQVLAEQQNGASGATAEAIAALQADLMDEAQHSEDSDENDDADAEMEDGSVESQAYAAAEAEVEADNDDDDDEYFSDDVDHQHSMDVTSSNHDLSVEMSDVEEDNEAGNRAESLVGVQIPTGEIMLVGQERIRAVSIASRF